MKKPEKYTNPLLHTKSISYVRELLFEWDSYKGVLVWLRILLCKCKAGGGSDNNFNRDFAVTDPELVRKWFYEAIELGETKTI